MSGISAFLKRGAIVAAAAIIVTFAFADPGFARGGHGGRGRGGGGAHLGGGHFGGGARFGCGPRLGGGFRRVWGGGGGGYYGGSILPLLPLIEPPVYYGYDDGPRYLHRCHYFHRRIFTRAHRWRWVWLRRCY